MAKVWSKNEKNYIYCSYRSSIFANEADVLDVKSSCDSNKNCSFDVTIKHKDVSWDHYVNKYEILSSSGAMLGTRVLFHPHVDEQPFTRSISNVKKIPKGVNIVTIIAYDSIHKYGGKEFKIKLF